MPDTRAHRQPAVGSAGVDARRPTGVARRRRLWQLFCVGHVAAFAAAAIVGITAVATPAARAAVPQARLAAEATTAPTPPSDTVQIGGGLAFTGAVITRPSTPTRRLNAYQAAVFVQAWFADLAFGQRLRREAPPKNVPVYRVLVTGLWSGPGAPAETREVFYAADPTTVWISFPHRPPITGRPASTTVPPPAKSWYVALPRVREAFAGTASLVPPAGTATTPTTSNASTSGEVAKHSSSSVQPWVLSVAAAAALGTAGLVAFTRKQSRARQVRRG